MVDVLGITGTLFCLMVLGYVAARTGVFDRAALNVLGSYVVWFALPAIIFRAISTQGLSEIVVPGYLGAYALGALSMMTAGYLACRYLLRRSAVASTFAAMGMSCSNSGFIGYPILLMVMPDIASRVIALNMLVENVLLIPLVLILAEHARGEARGRALARRIGLRLIGNPVIVAMLAGLAMSVSGLTLPGVLSRTVDLVAASSVAVSLIVIGGTLAGLPLRGALRLPVAVVVLGKLAVLPALVWLGLAAAGWLGTPVSDPRMGAALILVSATPAMSIYPVLAQRYGVGDDAALSMMVMTLASFATLSGVLLILSRGALAVI